MTTVLHGVLHQPSSSVHFYHLGYWGLFRARVGTESSEPGGPTERCAPRQVLGAEDAAAQLARVRGVSAAGAARMKAAWEESRGQREGMVLLRRMGVEDSKLAHRIVKRAGAVRPPAAAWAPATTTIPSKYIIYNIIMIYNILVYILHVFFVIYPYTHIPIYRSSI